MPLPHRRTTALVPLVTLLLPTALGAPAGAVPPPPAPPGTVAPPPPPPSVPPRPAPPTAGSCLGRWVGWGRNGGTPPWSIDMNITALSGASCGTIEYPSLGCGGFLERCTVQNGVVHFVERYTHNPGTCAPAGTIDARCQGSTMNWTWQGWETVRSTLRRR